MVYESGYKPGSENPTFTSDLSLSNSLLKLKKKPCEVCGSDANEHLMMTCFMCRDTREHTYCARVMLQRVPRLWICEECRDFSSIANKTANSQVEEAAQPSTTIQAEQVVVKEVCIDQTVPSSRTIQVPVDQTTPSSRTIVDNEDLIEAAAPSSRTNQVVDNKDWIEAAAPSLRSNHVVEQVVPVAPRIHEYTTDESTPESSSPVSPCSLRDETNLFHFNYPSLSLPPLMKN
ncbi:Zinc finger FYVE/PHD-type [Arabidopsis suecica]|uniref:Zinc finger FYVE/PHD-type n=1 Tax=Arabidopsis suecica TaxID=45249 RepID=A0A8T1XX40_ARASU|nr:Zinc finger FYVE/PHD-type [Arabidopsis suecica]